MSITKEQLKQIIEEEFSSVKKERQLIKENREDIGTAASTVKSAVAALRALDTRNSPPDAIRNNINGQLERLIVAYKTLFKISSAMPKSVPPKSLEDVQFFDAVREDLSKGITEQDLISIIKQEIQAVIQEAGGPPGGGFYYGPKDYSREPSGAYTSDRSKARASRTSSGYPGGSSKASGPMSDGEKAAAMEKCKEKGMMFTVRDGRIVCVHRESLDDGDTPLEEGELDEMFNMSMDPKKHSGPRHERDHELARKKQKTRPDHEAKMKSDREKRERNRRLNRRGYEEGQLKEADSASIQRQLDKLNQKYNKTDSDYNRIADLEKKLNAKLGKKTRSQGVSYNPYDY